MNKDWDDLAPIQQSELLAYSQLRGIEDHEAKTDEINALLSPHRKK